MVKTAYNKLAQSDSNMFAVYRQKPKSETRYYREIDARLGFMWNEARIYGEFVQKWPEDPAFVAYKKNRFNAQYVIVSQIKVEEVCKFYI